MKYFLQQIKVTFTSILALTLALAVSGCFSSTANHSQSGHHSKKAQLAAESTPVSSRRNRGKENIQINNVEAYNLWVEIYNKHWANQQKNQNEVCTTYLNSFNKPNGNPNINPFMEYQKFLKNMRYPIEESRNDALKELTKQHLVSPDFILQIEAENRKVLSVYEKTTDNGDDTIAISNTTLPNTPANQRLYMRGMYELFLNTNSGNVTENMQPWCPNSYKEITEALASYYIAQEKQLYQTNKNTPPKEFYWFSLTE